MEPATSLAVWVDRLVEWLADRTEREGLALRPCRATVVAEEENGQRRSQWLQLDSFEPRFQEILRITTRSWVNLHADSIDSDELRLVLEFISRRDDSAVTVPPGRISINMSGPEGGWYRIADRVDAR